MKSCYIANCDKSCNFDNSRNMFVLPSAPELMAEWAAVIPRNKRPLTKGDKICSRHFRESEIERYFEHNINGKKTQLLRVRPRLKNNSIPSQNLVVEEKKTKGSLKRKDATETSDTSKKQKLQVIEEVFVTSTNIEYDSLEESEPIYIEVETTEELAESNDKDNEPEVTKSKKETKSFVGKVSNPKEDDKKREDFEAIFEEVFAVQLPSQLWGIHRCPDMKFMAFSRFDTQSLNKCDLVVHISDLWQYTVSYKGVKVKQDCLSIMTEDSLSVLLDEVDSAKYIMNKNGEIQVKRKYNKQT